MPNLKLLAACALLPMLAGCATDNLTPTEVKAQMLGMSKDEALVCLGQPVNVAMAGDFVVWSYTYGTCTTHLTLANGRVNATRYSLSSKEDKTEDEQCAHVPQVVSCLRWLRH